MPDAYYGRGNAWYYEGRIRQGHRRLHQAIRLDPKYAEPTRDRGRRLAIKKRDMTRPSPTSTRPSGSTPRTPTPTSTGASPGASKKEYDKAIADFNEAIRLDPENAVGLLQPRATPGTRRRSTTRPSPITPRPSGSIPRTPRPTDSRGYAWIEKEEYDKAIADFNEAIRLDPKNAHAILPAAATPGTRRRSTTRPSPITPRPSGSIPRTPAPTSAAASSGRQEGIRQGHRRLRRGQPTRPSIRQPLTVVPGSGLLAHARLRLSAVSGALDERRRPAVGRGTAGRHARRWTAIFHALAHEPA